MKTTKAIILAVTALALAAMPAMAQPSRSGGGGHSRGGSSVSAPSRSSSSHSSSHSYSAPSRSSSTPSRSVNTPSRSSHNTPSASKSPSHSISAPHRSASAPSHSMGVPSRSGVGPTHSAMGRPAPKVHGAKPAGVAGPARIQGRANPSRMASHGPGHHHDYARPGRPGGHMPPSVRPIHPAPYFHHPWHRHYVHCHPIYWDPLPLRALYWPGFWAYCNSYWYDYHVTDVVVVRDYVKETYKVDIVTYGISDDIMYAIVKDGGDTFLQVYDKDDHLLAEQKINKKYCNMVIDAENGGCWISKKGDKDPLLFIWADGKLLIYEED